MQSSDIWQALGTPQLAEITAVVSIAISIVLAQKHLPRTKKAVTTDSTFKKNKKNPTCSRSMLSV